MIDVRITQVLPANTFKLPIFATKEFLKIQSTNNNFGYFFNDKFALPYFIGKYLWIKRLKFTESIISIKGEEENISSQKMFLNEVINLIDKEKIANFVAPPMAHCLFKTVPDDAEFVEWGSYIINLENLEANDEGILKLFPSNFRSKIHKGMNRGQIVSETTNVKIVHRLIQDTFRRTKSPYAPSVKFLTDLKEIMNGNVKYYVVHKDSKLLAALIIIYNELGAFSYYSGIAAKGDNSAMNLIYFRAVKDLVKMNVKSLNLMGARLTVTKNSKYAGIQEFKRRMGGELNRGFIFSFTLNKINYKIFNMLVYIYSHLKGNRYPEDAIKWIKRIEKEYYLSHSNEIVKY